MPPSLRSLVYSTLKLPSAYPAPGAHPLGTVIPAEIPAVVKAAVRTHRPDPLHPTLSYADYLHTVQHVDTHKQQLHRVEQWLYSDHPGAMPYAPGRTTQELVDRFSRDHHTPDPAGYVAYLLKAAPELHRQLHQPIRLTFPDKARERHTYVMATTGGGKSELLKLLIYGDVLEKKSAVVLIEPGGDLARQVAHWKEFNSGNRLVYVDPALARGKTPTINPFQISGIAASDTSPAAIEAKRVVAQQLRSALQEVIGTGAGATFTLPMRALLMPCILTLLDLPGATIRELHRFMDDTANADLVAFGATRTHYPDVASFFESGFGDPHFKITKKAIETRIQELLTTGTFAALTCGESTIDLEQALEHRKIIIFNLGKGSIGKDEGSAFGRLIVAMLQGIAERRARRPRSRIPCHVFLDEFHNYVTESIETLLREARKFRLMLTICQLMPGDGMTPAFANVVTGTTNLKIAGQADDDRAAAAAARLVHTDPPALNALDIGEFYIRWGNRPPFKIKTTTALLGDANAMAAPLWRRTVRLQLDRYYRSVEEPTPGTPPSEPGATRPRRRKMI